MAGHAESAPETEGLDGLAEFLDDTPQGTEEENEAQEADEPTGEEADTEEAADDQPDEADDEGDDPEEEAKKPTTDRKIVIKVKGDDGSETDAEVTEAELISGYHRQADYTRKMQGLAERENNAVQTLTAKHTEIQQEYLQKAEFTRQAIARLAGLDQDFSQLASTDPAAWVQESQRRQNVQQILGQLDQQIKGEREQASQSQVQRDQTMKAQMAQTAWAELSKAKIDKPALAKIFSDVSAGYGFRNEELANVYDHRLVLALRDAAAYRALKAKTPEVTKKAQDAPRLPQKQAVPAQTRQRQATENRFKSGRAKLSDLASYLNS